MVSGEQIIELVSEYVFDNMLPEYTFYNVKKGRFEEQSYLLWAVEELEMYISKRKTESPIHVLEDFANKMKRFSRLNSKKEYAFEIAHGLASNILDVCCAAGWIDK